MMFLKIDWRVKIIWSFGEWWAYFRKVVLWKLIYYLIIYEYYVIKTETDEKWWPRFLRFLKWCAKWERKSNWVLQEDTSLYSLFIINNIGKTNTNFALYSFYNTFLHARGKSIPRLYSSSNPYHLKNCLWYLFCLYEQHINPQAHFPQWVH